MASAHDPSLWWALDPEEMEPEPRITERPEPWLLSDEDIAMISLYGKTPFSILRQDLPRGEARFRPKDTHAGARWHLPDGTHVSWNSGTFHVDGVPLRVPYRSLNKILKNASRFTDIDWKRVLAAIDLAVRRQEGTHMNPGLELRDSTPNRVYPGPDIGPRKGTPYIREDGKGDENKAPGESGLPVTIRQRLMDGEMACLQHHEPSGGIGSEDAAGTSTCSHDPDDQKREAPSQGKEELRVEEAGGGLRPYGLGKAPDLGALPTGPPRLRTPDVPDPEPIHGPSHKTLLRGGYARNLVPQRNRRVQREGTPARLGQGNSGHRDLRTRLPRITGRR